MFWDNWQADGGPVKLEGPEVRSSGYPARYSFRSACIGSACIARRAGIPAAVSPITTRTPAATANTRGSSASISYRKLWTARAAKYDATPPATSPVTSKTAIWRSTITNTRPRVAPRAIRTPISVVRCDTFHATSP